MLFLDISAEKIKISAYGSQTGVSQDFLKTEDVAAVYQVAFSESVAEGMRRTANSGYACPLTATPEHLLDTTSS